ncbi:MAG: hypothetical protein RBT74_13495 [Tenuifilaceae bacterium]|nr:hypothetical protein [Tenuifilaceae bacterium]
MKTYLFSGYELTGIPIVLLSVYFISKTSWRLLPVYLIFAFQFLRGVIEYANLLSFNIVNFISELLVLFLLFRLFVNIKRIPKVLKPIIILYLVSFFSYLLNDSSFLEYILFLRRISVIFFMIIYFKESYYGKENILLEQFLVLLVLYQPIVSVIKLLFYGVAEVFIGTMSIGEGSITTNFGLIAIAYSLIYYLKKLDNKYLFAGGAFLVFIISGGKRAPLLYIPLLAFFIIFIYLKKFKNVNIISFNKLIMVSLFLLFSLIAILFYDSTLNPDTSTGIDLEHAENYIIDYVTEEGKDDVIGYGRAVAPRAIYDRLYDSGASKVLTGLGPGILIPSSLKPSEFGTDKEIFINQYGIGYGGRIGFLYIIFQIGVLGCILFVWFFINQFKSLYSKLLYFNNNSKLMFEFLLGLSCLFIFFLDFFSYSQVMFKINAASFLFAYIIGTRNNSFFLKTFN